MSDTMTDEGRFYRDVQRRLRAYRDTILSGSSGCLEVNLTTGYIEGEIFDFRGTESPVALEIAELSKPYKYDEFEKWWADSRLVSSKDDFLSKSNCAYLLKRFEEGARRVDVFCQSEMEGGGVSENCQSYFLSEDDETGEIYAICVVYDLAREIETREYEERIVTDQFTITKQAEVNAMLSSVADALLQEYEGLYLLRIDDDVLEMESIAPGELGRYLKTPDGKTSYSEAVDRFVKEIVAPEERETVLQQMSLSNIKETLAVRRSFSVWLTLYLPGEWSHREIRFIRYENDNVSSPSIAIIGVVNRSELEGAIEREYAVFKKMSEFLSDDYSAIYMVNGENGEYVEFEANGDYRTLGTRKHGTDFFADFTVFARKYVHPEDLGMVLGVIERGRGASRYTMRNLLTISFRLIIKGVPLYHRAVAKQAFDETGHHLVIGILNVDAETRRIVNLRREFESVQKELKDVSGDIVTYSTIANVLFQDFECCYYVNLETGHFTIYTPNQDGSGDLTPTEEGDGFFEWVQSYIPALVYQPDQEMFRKAFNQRWLVEELKKNRTCTIIGRFLKDGAPRYYQGRIALGKDDKHCMVIGIRDVDKAFKDELAIQEAHEELVLARVKNSTSQMHPHFLYNALGSIREIIHDDPEYASDLIVDFTTHLRACIRAMSVEGTVRFSQELENIKAYVRIEQMRFGDRLDVRYDIGCSDFEIVPLTIQPLVENAVRHGVFDLYDKIGVVCVRTIQEGEDKIIEVSDNGVGFDVEEVRRQVESGERDSTGMKNVIYRLERIMGASVDIQSKIGVGTTVRIVIPKEPKVNSDENPSQITFGGE